MKKLILFTWLMMVCLHVSAQIRIASPAEKKYSITKYDSLTNFVGANVNLYIGQELFVIPLREELQQYGYRDFFVSAEKKAQVYGYNKTIKRDSTDYEKKYKFRYDSEPAPTSTSHDLLANKSLKVIGIHKRPIKLGEDMPSFIEAGNYIYYLKLLNGADTLYYKSSDSETSFPFVVYGYFEKLKQINVGEFFYLRNNVDREWNDFNTGLPIKLISGSSWKCTDIVLDEYLQLLLIFSNTKGENISTEHYRMKFNFLPKIVGDRLKYRYGTLYTKAINGITDPSMSLELKTIASGEAFEKTK